MRGKKALINTLIGLLYEAILAISGLLIPRYILLYFGSPVNGMVNSIMQFLSVIALLRAGVGGVTRAALYKPLENQDFLQVGRILKATQNFMRKVAWIFAIGTVLLACVYFFFADDEFSWFYCFSLVLISGIGMFIQYYFGITYQLYLQADQKMYIWNCMQAVATLMNIVIALTLIFSGFQVHIVKLGTATSFALVPAMAVLYVRRKYRIDLNVYPDNSAIVQRWDAFSHQIATYIHENTDVVLLTTFSTLKEVSVYSVYSLVINSFVRRIIETVFGGFDAALGNMIARDEIETIDNTMAVYEFMTIQISSLLFASMIALMPSFVAVYTAGVMDVNYQRPVFLYLLALAEFVYCIRLPYYSIITAAGHYKQTKNGAISEAVINISISIALIWRLGIIGVAIGTLCAMLFRYIHLLSYTHKKIIKRNGINLLRYYVTSIAILLTSVLASQIIPKLKNLGFMLWIAYASAIAAIMCLSAIVFSLIICRREMEDCVRRILKIVQSHKVNRA